MSRYSKRYAYSYETMKVHLIIKNIQSSTVAKNVFKTKLRSSSGQTSSRLSIFVCLIFLSLAYNLTAAPEFNVKMSEAQIIKLGKQYGEMAERRLRAWQNLMVDAANFDEDEKLHRVNRFFNQMRFVDDIIHWKKKDYWASPVEFLITNGGDCEDFSIAKYYTLRQLGVPIEKLSIAYVKALKLNQAHMVLTYYSSPGKTPLILDNLIPEIKPANRRLDLQHVYSFNGDNLWLSKKGRRSTLVGTSDQLKPWVQLQSRMENQGF